MPNSPPSPSDPPEFPSEPPSFADARVTLVDDVELTDQSLSRDGKKNRALLTVLTGTERGAVYPIPGVINTIGRSEDSDISIPDPSLSRSHARLIVQANEFLLVDAGSTNGTFVNETPIEAETPLSDGARFRLGKRTVVSLSLHDELEEQAVLSIREAALFDRLTGVYNRGVFDDRLAAEMAFAQRHQTELSLVLFDIDHFKQFNDTHGHQTGDDVLVVVGEAVQRTVRTEDVLARYGGEEFIIIARSTPMDRAKVLGERVRRSISQAMVKAKGKQLRVTASVGIATLHSAEQATGKQLVGAADRALYAAKTAGRNRVIHADDLP